MLMKSSRSGRKNKTKQNKTKQKTEQKTMEKSPLLNSSSINYGEHEHDPENTHEPKPKLKEISSNRRESNESVDVEVPVKPQKEHSWLFKISLMAILVISGASMTLCMKNQDLTCIKNCENITDHNGGHSSNTLTVLAGGGAEGEPVYFHEPFFQLFHLGLGQLVSGVFTPMFDNKETGLKNISFRQFFPQAALASLFDVCAEILIILGLSLTLPSITEMLKTTMVVFVGMLSLYFFPGFVMGWKQWVAAGFMLVGSILVIMQNYITGEVHEDTASEVGGAFLVVGAQLFYGMEFVVEEKLIDHSKIKGLHVNKAQLVFALGVLSMTGAAVLQVPWTLITSSFSELGDIFFLYFEERSLWLSGIGISLGVMGFDLAGLGISEVMGSDRRAVSVAAFQVAIVWSISIGVGWEDFSFIALAGFLIILGSAIAYVYFSKAKTEPHQMKTKLRKV